MLIVDRRVGRNCRFVDVSELRKEVSNRISGSGLRVRLYRHDCVQYVLRRIRLSL